MKILHVNKFYHPCIGGIEQVAKDISEGLSSSKYRDFEVDMLVCHKKGSRSLEQINGVSVYRAASWGTLLSMPISLDFLFLFKNLSKNANVIFLHHPFPLGFLAYVLFGSDKPLVIWYHSDIVRQRLTAKLLTPLFKKVLKRADIIFTASEALKTSSASLVEFQDKCSVIPYGVRPELYAVDKETTKQARQIRSLYLNPLILSVGRLVYYKGFEYLIDAMQKVEGSLLIIGEGELRWTLLAKIKKLKLEDRVYILDSVKDLRPYYMAADLFVLPSVATSEAFGIVQIEAMAFGVPVVNTSLPTGVPEVSVHNESGLTVPPGDSQSLAAAINRTVNDSALRERFSKNAQGRVKSRFLKNHFVSAIAEALSGLI